MKSIYIGNLYFKTTHKHILDLFAQFGEVLSITMINDKNTKKFKGYAFVEMEDSNAQTAIEMLNDTIFLDRKISVKEATNLPKKLDYKTYRNY